MKNIYLTFLVFTYLILNSYSNAQCALVEVNLLGNGNSIADGDLTPSLTDHTDFGYVPACGGTIVRTFTIENTGTNSLNLANPTLSGTDAAEFSITLNPSATVAASGTTTFQVTFDPSTSGTKSATITFTNDDCDEATYDFAIEGRGISLPTAVCLPSTTNTGDFGTGIVNFVFNTINNTHSDFLNDGTQDFTCSNYTTVLPGSTYSFTANLYGTLGFGNNEYAQVYIDYNDDGVFSAGEIVYSNMSTREMVHTGNITIPTSGAVTGKLLRLRVKTDYSTFSDACSDPQYGEVEDYAIYIDCYAPTITGSTPATSCGSGSLLLAATASNGEVVWYSDATGGTPLTSGVDYSIDGNNNLIINNLATTTTFYAEAVDGDCVSASRTAVTATIYNCTKLLPQDCGANLEELNEILYYSPVANATNYEYLVEGPNGYSQTKLRGSNKVTMDMSWFPNLLMEATYTVKIRAFVDGVWQDYGDACNITTPKTKLRQGSCGALLTEWNKILYYSPVYNATDYEYLVEGPNGYSQTKTRGSNKTTMDISWFTGMLTNATYTVKIRARVGGIWGDYGDACTIKTPATTNLISGSCGRVLTALNKPLYYTEVYGATNYEYLVEGPNGYSQTHIRGNNKLSMDMTWLHNIQALTPSTIYTVKIRALVGGNWQDYGSACDITTPASLGLVVQNSGTELDKFETIELTAYPNPSKGDFTISSSHEGTFNIINELGQLVQTVEITKENNYQVQVGAMHALNPLQPGVYFITGTINNEVITRKIIVQ